MARLWDMLDAARAAISFIEGRTYRDFAEDRMLRSAVERMLEIIGEAARHVSADTREKLPELPWRSVIGFRNIVAHEYDRVRYDVVWRSCMEDVPRLITLLAAFGVDEDTP
jgi:uncharacterized protein with HEPN domain